MPDKKSIDPGFAAQLIHVAAEIGRIDIYGNEFSCFPDLPEEVVLAEFDGWTGKLLRTAIEAVADHAGWEQDELFAEVMSKAKRIASAASEQLAILESEQARMRRGKLLPAGTALDKIVRYEAHLERALYRALHEIQRL